MKGAIVGVLMGSKSDWETMQHSVEILRQLGIPYEAQALSAHRCPEAVAEYAKSAEQRGLMTIIAAAGGAAHLAGVVAAHTPLPVLGVPIESKSLKGLDSLLSIVQMPAGIPVATLAIGKAGAINAALLAAQIVGTKNPEIWMAFKDYRRQQTEKVLSQSKLENME